PHLAEVAGHRAVGVLRALRGAAAEHGHRVTHVGAADVGVGAGTVPVDEAALVVLVADAGLADARPDRRRAGGDAGRHGGEGLPVGDLGLAHADRDAVRRV